MTDPNPTGPARLRPMQRTTTKVPSRLLRKARMIAVAHNLRVEEYVEAVLRTAVERDYERMFQDGPTA